jgi:hypothetical protein
MTSPQKDIVHDSPVLPVICPNCLSPNAKGSHQCGHCATALTSYAEIDPMGQIYAQGDVFRKAVGKPRKPIVLIGMWLILGPNAIYGTGKAVQMLFMPFTDPSQFTNDPPSFFLTLCFFGLAAAVLDTVLYRLTRNYLRQSGESDYSTEQT